MSSVVDGYISLAPYPERWRRPSRPRNILLHQGCPAPTRGARWAAYRRTPRVARGRRRLGRIAVRLLKGGVVGGVFQRVTHERNEAQRVRDLSIERHAQCLAKCYAAHAEPLSTLRPYFAGHKPSGKKPHRVFVCDGIRQVRLSKPLPTRGFEPGLFPQLPLGGA